MSKHLGLHPAYVIIVGGAAGFVCGLLGAGGGLLLIPLLRHSHLPQTHLHATCMAAILPLSLLSGWLYLGGGHLSPTDVLPYLAGGLVGAVAGGLLLSRMDNMLLRRIFAVFLIYAGLRQLGVLSLFGL